MLRTESYTSSGVSSRERRHAADDHFKIFPAALGASSEKRVQQRRQLGLRSSSTVISTDLSSNGWLVTATLTNVRLYDLDSQAVTNDVKREFEFSIETQSRNERIRAVAISEDLLAVVTHYRLIVYEYREKGGPEEHVLEDLRIDQNETWTPRSVSIKQLEAIGTRQSAAAWIIVGGEGVIGAKLFHFSNISCWNSHRDHRLLLRCPQNTSSVRIVGFSQFMNPKKFVIFGVTSDNRIFCWDVHVREFASPIALAGWELDGAFEKHALVSRRFAVLRHGPNAN
jgi:WD40 repeat protein